MTWTASLGGTAYTLSSSGSTLAVGSDPVTVTVTPPTLPASTAKQNDIITITTDIVDDTLPHKIGLFLTPTGDVISVTPTTTLDLGSLVIATPPNTADDSTSIQITNNNANSGSPDAKINISSDNTDHFTVVTPSPISVPAGSTARVTVRFTPGSVVTDANADNQFKPVYTGNISWSVDSGDANCGQVSSGSVAVVGHGSLDAGGVNPTALNFGPNFCDGTKTDFSPVTVHGVKGQTYSAALTTHNYYWINNKEFSLSNVLITADSGDATFDVYWELPDTGLSFPDNGIGTVPYTDTLTVTYAGQPMTVPISMTVKGTVLDITVGLDVAHRDSGPQFNVIASSNTPWLLSAQFSGANANDFSVATVQNNCSGSGDCKIQDMIEYGVNSGDLTCNSDGSGPATADFTISKNNGHICKSTWPLPHTVAVTGCNGVAVDGGN